jgi:hypothetical protein
VYVRTFRSLRINWWFFVINHACIDDNRFFDVGLRSRGFFEVGGVLAYFFMFDAMHKKGRNLQTGEKDVT